MSTRELLSEAQRARLSALPEMGFRELARHHTLSEADLTGPRVALRSKHVVELGELGELGFGDAPVDRGWLASSCPTRDGGSAPDSDGPWMVRYSLLVGSR